MDVIRPPMIIRDIPFIIAAFSFCVNIIGIMDSIVVSVVIRIGRRRMHPLSINASFSGIVSFNWFAVSTYKIPLFTTIPTSISTPIKEVIFSVESVINKRKKESK